MFAILVFFFQLLLEALIYVVISSSRVQSNT